jgi:hypothetical protein
MSADSFYVGYGVRWEVDASDTEAIRRLEERRDSRQLAAKQHKLRCWWGATSDETRYFVLIGRLVGQYGWEDEAAGKIAKTDAIAVMKETESRLRAAGFEQPAAWHFQFIPG